MSKELSWQEELALSISQISIKHNLLEGDLIDFSSHILCSSILNAKCDDIDAVLSSIKDQVIMLREKNAQK